tara:strand:+ start:1887 stop:4352 length:2466 start_codon:yes stop_codon:yes gene_type:complete
MPTTRTFSQAFAGGEISPEMFGRISDTKYQTGAAKMRNFIAKPQGPAENRAGLKFVKEVKDSTKATRLLSFTFNTTQTMVIEMGDQYFRFHTQGLTLQYTAGAAWNSSTNYSIGAIASSGGNNYYSRTGGTNKALSNATHWYLLPADLTYEIPSDYLEAELFDVHYVQSADIITLVHPNHPPKELKRFGATNWQLETINFGTPIAAPTGVSASRSIPNSANVQTDTYESHKYKVTAVLADQVSESSGSSTASVSNNIYVTGAKNTITWNARTGASTYRVYKEQGGIFGFIGETATTTLVDNNIGPDFSRTPPKFENEFQSTGNYPGAVSYFEQRRVFAGTNNEPQSIFMTKSGTESNLSFGLPIRDDDRVKFKVAAREANTIRHIVPLTQLVLLTGSAEWRVSSINNDAITPSSISVKPQSYVGSNNAQPVIVNNSMVYAAARGGHIRELGYNWQANGFITGDLSLRAPHLFDNLTVVDMALSKSPIPIVYFVSSNGKMIGLTYVPEQSIGAWHQHDTDGLFESVASVSEGNDDVIYAVVKRTVNGNSVRYVERMGTRLFENPRDCFFVDAGATLNGTNTDPTRTVTITGGTTYKKGEIITITTNYDLFNAPPSTDDVGDAIVLVDGTNYYRLNIVATSTQRIATAKLDRDLPVAQRNTAISSFEVARNKISGITWLEGKTVSILADGAVHPQRVVTSGTITLDRASSIVHFGLPYDSDLETLPLALQAEAFGQGRVKNLNHAWLRVLESSGIFAGPTPDKLVEAKQRTTEPYGTPPALKTEDIKIMLTPTWSDYGQIFIRQNDPLPLTIVGITLEVAVGG